MTALRILIPEGSSLSAREAVAVLGMMGYVIDVLDPDQYCICRFSRYVRRVHQSPRLSDSPGDFAGFLLSHLSTHKYDLVLPVHEHALLLSAVAEEIRKHCTVAVAPFAAFEQLQNKVRFCELLRKLRLPQPLTQAIASPAEFPSGKPMPYYVKTAFGTAGDGTWRVSTAAELTAVMDALRARETTGNLGTFLIQDVAAGTLEVVQSVFERGRLIATHGYRQQIEGVGGSASGRISVHRPGVIAALRRIGESLDWHGALMLDYIHNDATGEFWFIDPNPRLGESMNAFMAGINLPDAMIRLSRGEQVPWIVSTSGIRSHILLPALLATAIRNGTRGKVLNEMLSAWRRVGAYAGSREEVMSISDPLSILPIFFVAMRLLLHPSAAQAIASHAIKNYAVTERAANCIRPPTS
jgi:predicted ATP-grasp superfamily ATP-dependent carboligase